MHKDRTLHECNEKEIEELLLGHKIVVDKSDNLVLDNGVVLQINPNIGCGGCESGNYYSMLTGLWMQISRRMFQNCQMNYLGSMKNRVLV